MNNLTNHLSRAFRGAFPQQLRIVYANSTALHLRFWCIPAHQTLSGSAEIVEIRPQSPLSTFIPNVRGHYTQLSLKERRMLLHLSGTFSPHLSPAPSNPQEFKALMSLDSDWNGKGSFCWGEHYIEDAVVNPVDETDDLIFGH
ncbi:MAG: DUF1842 domain-containing protein [Bacteroidota bacterium]